VDGWPFPVLEGYVSAILKLFLGIFRIISVRILILIAVYTIFIDYAVVSRALVPMYEGTGIFFTNRVAGERELV